MRARSCNAQCTAQIWDICRYSVSLQKASGQRANRCTESRDIQSDAAALLVSASTDGFEMGMVIKIFWRDRHTSLTVLEPSRVYGLEAVPDPIARPCLALERSELSTGFSSRFFGKVFVPDKAP